MHVNAMRDRRRLPAFGNREGPEAPKFPAGRPATIAKAFSQFRERHFDAGNSGIHLGNYLELRASIASPSR
jgi:hypothetical protein